MKAPAAKKLPIMPIAEFVATSLEATVPKRKFDKMKDIPALLKAKAQQSYELKASFYDRCTDA